MFRQLTESEKEKFRQWARTNYIPHTEINEVWHPVVQSECRRINEEMESKPGEYQTETFADKKELYSK